MDKKKGLTLIELAVVLVIIGIILGIGVSVIAVLIKQAKYKDTKKIVETACETVKAYAITNKTLPSNLSSLGIKTQDAYNQELIYVYANNLDSLNLCQNNPSSWVNLTDKGITKNKVAFLIYSISENRHDDTKNGSNYEIKQTGAFYSGYEYDDIYCYVDIETIRKEACEPLKITTEALPIGTQFQQYPSTKIEGSVPNITCNITGLPQGLTDNNCRISGTPKKAGTFQVNVSITDSIGRTDTKTYGLVIHPNPVKITTPYLPYAYKDKSYNVALTAIGGSGRYNWEITGSLPAGLSFSNGIITGTPTQTGTFQVNIKAKDSSYFDSSNSDSYDEIEFTLTVLDNTVSSGGSGSGSGSGGGGGSGGSGGGYNGCSYLYIINKDKAHSYKILPNNRCYNYNYGSIAQIDLSQVNVNNDRFALYYRVNRCQSYRLICDPVLISLLNEDDDGDCYIKLDETDYGDRECEFEDY